MKQWQEDDFEIIKVELEKLSLEQLKILAQKTGIIFEGDPKMEEVDEDDIILVLEETDPNELKLELNKLINIDK